MAETVHQVLYAANFIYLPYCFVTKLLKLLLVHQKLSLKQQLVGIEITYRRVRPLSPSLKLLDFLDEVAAAAMAKVLDWL